MSDKAYRKDAELQLSSPDDLRKYIKVANPSLIVVCAAVFILIAGFIGWTIWGHVHTYIDALAVVEDGKMSLYFDYTYGDEVEAGLNVSGLPKEYVLPDNIREYEVVSCEKMDPFQLYLSGFSKSGWLCCVTDDTVEIENGVYPVNIHIDNYSLKKLLLDKEENDEK